MRPIFLNASAHFNKARKLATCSPNHLRGLAEAETETKYYNSLLKIDPELHLCLFKGVELLTPPNTQMFWGASCELASSVRRDTKYLKNGSICVLHFIFQIIYIISGKPCCFHNNIYTHIHINKISSYIKFLLSHSNNLALTNSLFNSF